jgi:hypothetical protein
MIAKRKQFFFEEKDQKTSGQVSIGRGRSYTKLAKVSASFFKKKPFLSSDALTGHPA